MGFYKTFLKMIMLWFLLYGSLKFGQKFGEHQCMIDYTNITLLHERDMALAEASSLTMKVHIYENGKLSQMMNLVKEKNKLIIFENKLLKETCNIDQCPLNDDMSNSFSSQLRMALLNKKE